MSDTMTEEDFSNLSYDEAMVAVIETLSEATKPEIAITVIEIFNEALELIHSEDMSERLMAHVSFACVGGFMIAHANHNEPTPIMLAGSMIGQVEQFMKRAVAESEHRQAQAEAQENKDDD